MAAESKVLSNIVYGYKGMGLSMVDPCPSARKTDLTSRGRWFVDETKLVRRYFMLIQMEIDSRETPFLRWQWSPYGVLNSGLGDWWR